jgi:hypothetical protein
MYRALLLLLLLVLLLTGQAASMLDAAGVTIAAT